MLIDARSESLILAGEELPGVWCLTPLSASGGASVGSDSLAEGTARTQELLGFCFGLVLKVSFFILGAHFGK